VYASAALFGLGDKLSVRSCASDLPGLREVGRGSGRIAVARRRDSAGSRTSAGRIPSWWLVTASSIHSPVWMPTGPRVPWPRSTHNHCDTGISRARPWIAAVARSQRAWSTHAIRRRFDRQYASGWIAKPL